MIFGLMFGLALLCGAGIGALYMQARLFMPRWEKGFKTGYDLGVTHGKSELWPLRIQLNCRILEVNIWRSQNGLPLEEYEEYEEPQKGEFQ